MATATSKFSPRTRTPEAIQRKDESDDEYDDEKRCLHQCFKKKKKKNDRKAGWEEQEGGVQQLPRRGAGGQVKGSAGSTAWQKMRRRRGVGKDQGGERASESA